MASEGFHENEQELSPAVRDRHRALVSLTEELDAIDWYRQRAEVCADADLREILLHNMREEIEHACMVLEWLRRTDKDFDEQLRTYLFKDKPIVGIEEHGENGPSASRSVLTRGTVGSMRGM